MITVDFARIAVEPGFRILDIGCGSGRHTGKAYGFKDVTVIGSDLNFTDLTEAKNRLHFHDAVGESGGGVWGLTVADIRRLPFADDSFDIVICSEVMEHIPEHQTAAKELVRVLKPGRELVVSVPRYLPEWICWKLSDDYGKANQGHVRIYRKKPLIALLENCGVNHRDAHFAHGLHSPYWWLKCLVGPTRSDAALVNLYHRFLVWDIMKKPRLTGLLDRFLNPFIGKSLVLYFHKPAMHR